MIRSASVFCLTAVVAVAASASVAEAQLFPAPAPAPAQQEDKAPVPKGVAEVDAVAEPVIESTPVELYDSVKYRDLHHIAPCAEHLLIEVRDPCWKRDACVRGPQVPRCVNVVICVPKTAPSCAPAAACGAPTACGAPQPCSDACGVCNCRHRQFRHIGTKTGHYQRYDYGRYRVEIRVRRDHIDVDYDD